MSACLICEKLVLVLLVFSMTILVRSKISLLIINERIIPGLFDYILPVIL